MGPFGALSFSVSLLSAVAVAGRPLTDVNTNCSCGFYDPRTTSLYTEATIAYFNETKTFPTGDFELLSFENKYEKGFNCLYRTGAAHSNVQFNDSVSPGLTLFIDQSTSDHLVDGAGFQTRRQDVRFGTFRAAMKPAPAWAGGSALSMIQMYNESESIEIDVMNTDRAETAWVATLMRGEWPERSLGTNFTVLERAPAIDGTTHPWDFTEYRFDWRPQAISYYVGLEQTRKATEDADGQLPMTPSPLYFKHWSTGNQYLMEGPPWMRSYASIEWIRMFYNSSVMNEEQHNQFDRRCSVPDACLVEDTTLRGSTPYSNNSTKEWEARADESVRRVAATCLVATSVCFGAVLLIHALFRRAPWASSSTTAAGGVQEISSLADPTHVYQEYPPTIPSQPSTSSVFNSRAFSSQAPTLASGHATPYGPTRPPSTKTDDDMLIQRVDETPEGSVRGSSTLKPPHPRFGSIETLPGGSAPPTLREFPLLGSQERIVEENASTGIITTIGDETETDKIETKDHYPPDVHATERSLGPNGEKIPGVNTTEVAPAPAPPDAPLQPSKRVDYLAGIVALCALLVTVVHFCLTFVPAVISPTADVHYESERWTERTVSPFILSFWIGIFFTTTSRFLVGNYLRNGDLGNVAQKAVGRTPRLMIPVAALALFEYFVIDAGAVKWIEYVPSISWSTWPYVARYTSFGAFLSEVLELVYLVPNAAPQITSHYCTGVLWTIPVQLQGSWLVLCGVVVVREIRTPWKRLGFYAVVILTHWYAQSWGSYLWFGVLLADLDVTYKYRKWLWARPWAYYPALTACTAVLLLAPAAELLAQWTPFSLSVAENGIHPDAATGLPIGQTPLAGSYPQYYTPRVNGFFFAAGLQALVDMSPLMQRAMSLRLLVLVHPHIFTIYLVHGLIFWSLGAWICVTLAAQGVLYWANTLVTGVASYALLFACLPIVTPVIEVLGKTCTALVWQFASQTPPRRHPTLYPFSKELIRETHVVPKEAPSSETETASEKSKEVAKAKKEGNFF